MTDVVEGIYKVFQKGRRGEIYNLGSGKAQQLIK